MENATLAYATPKRMIVATLWLLLFLPSILLDRETKPFAAFFSSNDVLPVVVICTESGEQIHVLNSTSNTLVEEESAAVAMPPLPCGASGTQVGGTVWQDVDYDGVLDAPKEVTFDQPITVTVYDCDGTVLGTTTSSVVDGTWTLDVSSAAACDGGACSDVRVEYTGIPSWAQPTAFGENSGTSVQFVSPGDCADFGVFNPNDFCQTQNHKTYLIPYKIIKLLLLIN